MVKPEPYPKPTWKVPAPPGYPAAIENAATFAAPLLAGFGLTFAGLVMANASDFRYSDIAIFFLIVATISLIYAIQFGFFARQYAVTPAELEAWWPDLHIGLRRERVRDEQRRFRIEYQKWVRRFRLAYHLGIVCIWAGIAVALVPSAQSGRGDLRLAAAGVVALAAVLELAWVVRIARNKRRQSDWLRPIRGAAERPAAQRKGRHGMSLKNRAINVAPIKAPAMNITLGTAGALSIAAALAAWKKSFEFVFGDSGSVPYGVREGVLIATIAAIVLVAAADMIARAIAARQDKTHIVPWGGGWSATWTGANPHEGGLIVAGMRVRATDPDSVEYLLVKEGSAPTWRPAGEVVLDPPA